jgi:hypothetical protein
VPATPENAQSVEENFPGIIRFPSANAALNVEKEYIPEEDNINVLLGFFRGQITHQRRREWKRELFR